MYIRADARGKGVGMAIGMKLTEILLRMGIVNLFGGTTLPNPGSVGLHEALGFRPIGVFHSIGYKCGAWHDVGWYELQLQPRPANPAPPIPWPELASQDASAKRR